MTKEQAKELGSPERMRQIAVKELVTNGIELLEFLESLGEQTALDALFRIRTEIDERIANERPVVQLPNKPHVFFGWRSNHPSRKSAFAIQTECVPSPDCGAHKHTNGDWWWYDETGTDEYGPYGS